MNFPAGHGALQIQLTSMDSSPTKEGVQDSLINRQPLQYLPPLEDTRYLSTALLVEVHLFGDSLPCLWQTPHQGRPASSSNRRVSSARRVTLEVCVSRGVSGVRGLCVGGGDY